MSRSARLYSLAIVTGLLIGAAQLWSSLVIPAGIGPLKNAASPWIVLAFAVALPARRLREALQVAVVTFLALVTGYYVAEALRGWPVSSHQVVLWSVLSLVAGPLIGAAAYATRHAGPVLAAIGVAVPGGLLIGEAAHGIASATYPTPLPFWRCQVALGIVLTLAPTVWRARRAGVSPVAAAVLAAAVVAAVTYGVFALL